MGNNSHEGQLLLPETSEPRHEVTVLSVSSATQTAGFIFSVFWLSSSPFIALVPASLQHPSPSTPCCLWPHARLLPETPQFRLSLRSRALYFPTVSVLDISVFS